MKKAGIVISAILLIVLICGGFYFVMGKSKSSPESGKELSKVQRIITKDLDKQYPETPREVIKFYNSIIVMAYSKNYTDEEFEGLVDQELCLFDADLLANNPKSVYSESLKADIEKYAEEKKSLSQSEVCDSDKVKYITDGDDKIAYVRASYFVKDNKSCNETYQEYVLRQDKDGKWKILTFYQVDGF